MVLAAIVTIAGFLLRPSLFDNFAAHPLGFIFPAFTLAGLAGITFELYARRERLAFLASCVYLLGMLTSVAYSLYPRVLPSSTNPAFALTIDTVKAGDHGLRVGVVWWIIGMALVAAYSVHTYRSFAGKVKLPEAEETY